MPTPGRTATLAEIESYMVQAGFTQAQIQAFATWYAAALKQDPSLTPLDGYTVWAVGTDVSGGGQAAANLIGDISNKGLPAVASAGGKAANALPTITNPLDFLRNIASFFDKLSQANTWLRIGEFILGAGLIIVGLAKLASDTPAGKAAKKIAVKAALI